MTTALSLPEKFAFVKMVDSVINADEVIHDAEIEIMDQLMHRYKFDSAFIAKAKEKTIDECISILISMPPEKKSVVIQMLKVVALSDGFVHKKEMAMIIDYCESIGLCHKIGKV